MTAISIIWNVLSAEDKLFYDLLMALGSIPLRASLERTASYYIQPRVASSLDEETLVDISNEVNVREEQHL